VPQGLIGQILDNRGLEGAVEDGQRPLRGPCLQLSIRVRASHAPSAPLHFGVEIAVTLPLESGRSADDAVLFRMRALRYPPMALSFLAGDLWLAVDTD
jgi:hypothetical protein